MGFSFIHVSDIHLGRPFSDLSKYADDIKVRNIYKNAVEKSFNKMIDYALLNNVDFVLISGDTFDCDEQDFESKLILKKALKKLESAQIKVYLVCGNHDPLSSYNKITFDFDVNSNIKIVGLNSNFYESFSVFEENKEAGIINCFSFRESTCYENPLKYFPKVKEGVFNIGLLHCDLDGVKDSPYAPCLKSELEAFGYDYWALGHIHIPEYISDKIKYAGTVQGRNTKETGAHGFYHICVEQGKISKNLFIPCDVVRFDDIEIDLSDCPDIVAAASKITDFAGDLKNEDCSLFLLRVNLVGNIDYYGEINEEFYNKLSDRIKTEFDEKICISQIYNNTSVKTDIELIRSDEGITGTIFKIMQDDKNREESFQIVRNKLNKLLEKCNFSDEDYNELNKNINQEVKKHCLNICNAVYNRENKEK